MGCPGGRFSDVWLSWWEGAALGHTAANAAFYLPGGARMPPAPWVGTNGLKRGGAAPLWKRLWLWVSALLPGAVARLVTVAGGGGLLLPLRRLQGLLDQPQHELSLGQLPARALGLTLQVRLDPLEKFLRDLEGQGPGIVVRHGYVPSIFFHFEVFGEQFGDVLCGGQARRLSGFGNFLMQVEADLRALW